MKTIIITKDGERLSFVTQQYEIGLYCIINDDPSQQHTFDVSEKEFHKNIRKLYIEKGGQIVNE